MRHCYSGERQTQRLLNASAQSQMELLSRPHSEAQATRIAEEIETLIHSLQQIETEIRQTSPHYAALMQPQPLTLREIQTQVLDQDTLLLEYSLGDERSYLWVVSSGSVTSYELPGREAIETAGRRFYNLVNTRNRDVKGETSEERAVRIAQADLEVPLAAAALSRILLGPVAGQLGKKEIDDCCRRRTPLCFVCRFAVANWRRDQHPRALNRRARNCEPSFRFDTIGDQARSGRASKRAPECSGACRSGVHERRRAS